MNTDIKPWDSDWIVGDPIGGGGQGTTHLATRRHDQQLGVIKFLKYQDELEARRRMFREVANLKILESVGCKTPRVYSHNTDQFENADVSLYFVMEHVKGESLSSCITRLKGLSLEQSVSLALDICATFRIAINQAVLHRDLKPENVIVRNLEPPDVVIVDYGLSFNHAIDDDLTRVSETLDNKFLSLPERRVPGGDRRDPRSDLTGICAMLFYCMMGEAPVDLVDANNRPPHRRHGRSVKEKFGNDLRASQIEVFFDRAFAQSIDNRFQTIDELETRLVEFTKPSQLVSVEEPSIVAQRYAELLFKHDRKTQLAAYKLAGTGVIKEIARLYNTHSRNLAPFTTGVVNSAPELKSPPQTESLGLSYGFSISIEHNRQVVRAIYTIVAKGSQGGVFRAMQKLCSPHFDQWVPVDDWTIIMWYNALEGPDTSPLTNDLKTTVVRAMTIIQEDILNPEKPTKKS